jgi:hypothetical protein
MKSRVNIFQNPNSSCSDLIRVSLAMIIGFKKCLVFVLGFLSLLWIGAAEASVDGLADELDALLRKHPLTLSSSSGEQVALFKKVSQLFKDQAETLIPFKEAPVARPSQKPAVEYSPDGEADEDLSPRSPVAVDTATEIVHYSPEEMISCITNLCYPTAAAHYEKGMRTLFASGKPPKHGAKQLTEGLQCLGGKMLFARALVERAGLRREIGENLQMTAINQVLNFHRPTLADASPPLVSAIPTDIPGCPACLGLPRLPKY